MKSLNTYILEGLLNKDSTKEKSKLIAAKNFLKKFVNTSVSHCDDSYIFIYSLQNQFENGKGGSALFDINSSQKNDFILNFKYKSSNTNDRSLIIRPQKRIYDRIDSDYPNGWSLPKINAIEPVNVFYYLQSWDPMTVNNVDANVFSKGIPHKLIGKIKSTLIYNDGYSKNFTLKNFSIESSSSIIFVNQYGFSGFKFENCNIKTPKRILFIEPNLNQRKKFATNANYNYFLGEYSNSMIKNFSGLNYKCDILEFISGIIYSDIYRISKEGIPQGDRYEISKNIWENGIFPDKNSNYLLEAAIVWLLPYAIYLKSYCDKKKSFLIGFAIDSTRDNTFEYSISELLEIIPNTGKNHQAVKLFEQFVSVLSTNTKEIRFVHERGKYASVYGNVYTLIYNTTTQKLHMASNQNIYRRYKNLINNFYNMQEKIDEDQYMF